MLLDLFRPVGEQLGKLGGLGLVNVQVLSEVGGGPVGLLTPTQ
jgi:hypothetical protein